MDDVRSAGTSPSLSAPVRGTNRCLAPRQVRIAGTGCGPCSMHHPGRRTPTTLLPTIWDDRHPVLRGPVTTLSATSQTRPHWTSPPPGTHPQGGLLPRLVDWPPRPHRPRRGPHRPRRGAPPSTSTPEGRPGDRSSGEAGWSIAAIARQAGRHRPARAPPRRSGARPRPTDAAPRPGTGSGSGRAAEHADQAGTHRRHAARRRLRRLPAPLLRTRPGDGTPQGRRAAGPLDLPTWCAGYLVELSVATSVRTARWRSDVAGIDAPSAAQAEVVGSLAAGEDHDAVVEQSTELADRCRPFGQEPAPLVEGPVAGDPEGARS